MTLRVGMILAVAVLTFSSSAPGDEQKSTQVSSERKVLNRFLGDWRQSFTVFKAEWTPKERRGTGTFSSTRILRGEFVQEMGMKADGNSHLTLYTYDKKRKSYRMWYFSSTGQAGEVAGKWDAATKSLVWKWDASNGLTGTGVHRFVKNDSFEFSTMIKDKNGKLFFHRAGKATRIKKDRE